MDYCWEVSGWDQQCHITPKAQTKKMYMYEHTPYTFTNIQVYINVYRYTHIYKYAWKNNSTYTYTCTWGWLAEITLYICMAMFYCLLDAPYPPLNHFREGEPLAHRSARLQAPYQTLWRASWQRLPPSLKKKPENAGSKPGYGETCVFGAAD